ncbi:MAG: hypothetical protein H6765_03805 [Candidatus Peribacteria bacterium]|nr:MAG: hypothetical protein H6765_03805 [Candidatus Peribacteria bacterium]
MREYFADTAYWNPEIITQGGRAEVDIVLPDNLTTRVIDVIGLSKDIKLGTVSQELLVEQPFLLEANAPSFVTIGDQLELPIKMIVSREVLEQL